MLFVKTLPCAALTIAGHRCNGVVEADHAGPRPMGRKCSDFEVIPLCQLAHEERPGRRGAFAYLSKEAMREWVADVIKATQEVAVERRAPDVAALLEYLGRTPAACDVDLPF